MQRTPPDQTTDAVAVAGATRRAFVVRTLSPGLILVAASAVLGAWIYSRGNNPFGIDLAWNAFLAAGSTPVLIFFSRAMNVAGGTWFGILVVPLVIALLLIVRRRPWSAAYFLTAEAVSAGLVQVLKHTFGRARPEDIAVVSDYGSFPSGHVANAATIVTALIVIFPRLWTVIGAIAWVLVMAFSRTYLHAHWLSDTLGAALVGTGAALVIAAVFTVPLLKERAPASARRIPAEPVAVGEGRSTSAGDDG